MVLAARPPSASRVVSAKASATYSPTSAAQAIGTGADRTRG